jgi:hypothetical protein
MSQETEKQKRLDEIKNMAKNRGNVSQAQASNNPWAKEAPVIPATNNRKMGGYKGWN